MPLNTAQIRTMTPSQKRMQQHKIQQQPAAQAHECRPPDFPLSEFAHFYPGPISVVKVTFSGGKIFNVTF